MDQLSYTYDQSGNSNKLIRVNDASGNAAGYPVGGNTIGYDINGNMVNHLDKGISNIAYNYLNLPSSITASMGNTDYVYRADGTKVRKVFGGKTTDYLDGFQYENGVLQFVPTSEGYYDITKNKYIYNYTDHLGNVRLSYTKGASGGAEIIEENNYYPFGLKHQGYNSTSLANSAYQYKYNGKELQETGMYDYGARMYMPELGRWGVVDPLAEKYQSMSPYNYVANNPINAIDPDGKSISPIFDSNTGNYLGNDSKGFLSGEVLFMDKKTYEQLSSNSKNGVIDHDVAVKNSTSISKLDDSKHSLVLFGKATNYINRALYQAYYGENIKDNLKDGYSGAYSLKLGVSTPNLSKDGTPSTNEEGAYGYWYPYTSSIDYIGQNFDARKELNTSANIFSNFEHEFRGHGDRSGIKINLSKMDEYYNFYEHKAIYKMQMNSKNFPFTTGSYKQNIINRNKYYDQYPFPKKNK
ncbi:RHS repeat-associated core domain-containing protein, partial [Elizabethkingia miricola]|uniref:RHS repeat domain-containing protein n=6 Tax=Weeksellaceae TaxID=2762318 RepID=UPI0020196EC3